MSTEPFHFSKKGQRKMSSFMAQELLYEFVSNQLDEERRNAVLEFIQSSREAQIDIQKIKNGLDYVHRLSETQVDPSVLERAKAPTTYFQLVHQKMRVEDWSPGIKMGLEVLFVALMIISVSILIPWHKLMEINWSISRDVILAEVEKKQARPSESGSEESNASDGAEVFPDEAVGKVNPVQAKPNPVQIVTVAPVVPPAPAEPQTSAAKPVNPVQVRETKPSAATPDHKGVAGALYRGSITVTNVAATTSKFVEKIQELGGRKAGEVELGWKKGDSSYFHMTIPESKYPAFLEFAKDYGSFRANKEKHERVMPEGIIRIIFTIDEKKAP